MSTLIAEFEQEIPTGIYPTANARQAPFWADGRNMVFEDMAAKPSLGQYGMFFSEVSRTVLGVKTTLQSGRPTVYYGTRDELKKWAQGVGVLNVTPPGGFTGTSSDLWSFARWGNWMVASNGVDPIHVDKNDGAGFVPIDTPFDWAKLIYATDTQLIAANTSFGGDHIAWCDVDDLEDWQPVASNFAGDKTQRNIDSEFMALSPIGSNLGLMTNNEMILMSFSGAPFVFNILPLQEGFGVPAKNGLVAVNKLLYGIGRRGIWVSDTTTSKRIDNPAIHEFIYGDSPFRMDLDQAHRAVGFHDALQTSVVFYYTTIGATRNNIGVTFNYSNNTWSIHSFGRSAAVDSGVFPFAITGDAHGNIYQQSVVGAAPLTGDLGELEVDWHDCNLTFGCGELGCGELGCGGVMQLAG